MIRQWKLTELTSHPRIERRRKWCLWGVLLSIWLARVQVCLGMLFLSNVVWTWYHCRSRTSGTALLSRRWRRGWRGRGWLIGLWNIVIVYLWMLTLCYSARILLILRLWGNSWVRLRTGFYLLLHLRTRWIIRSKLASILSLPLLIKKMMLSSHLLNTYRRVRPSRGWNGFVPCCILWVTPGALMNVISITVIIRIPVLRWWPLNWRMLGLLWILMPLGSDLSRIGIKCARILASLYPRDVWIWAVCVACGLVISSHSGHCWRGLLWELTRWKRSASLSWP